MKVWPIDPLVPRNLRLEVPEKLPQGSPSTVPGPTIVGPSPQNRGQHTWMREHLVRSTVLPAGVTLQLARPERGTVTIRRIETIRSRVGYLSAGLTGSTLAKVWAPYGA